MLNMLHEVFCRKKKIRDELRQANGHITSWIDSILHPQKLIMAVQNLKYLKMFQSKLFRIKEMLEQIVLCPSMLAALFC